MKTENQQQENEHSEQPNPNQMFNQTNEILLSEEQKERLLKELSITSRSNSFVLMEIDYYGAEASGKTIICLGEHSIHIRSKGQKTGKFWNESLALHEQDSRKFDLLFLRRRKTISGMDLIRRERTQDEIIAATSANKFNDKIICHLIIYFSDGGSFELNGLSEPVAISVRRVIHNWSVNL
jgi:hypothetical protein